MKNQLPVAFIEGMPLADAPQLDNNKMSIVLLEQGRFVEAGGQIQFFSPWKLSVHSAASELLSEIGSISSLKVSITSCCDSVDAIKSN
ncbi:hypothetical protein BK120_23700 [Paenibacillus sp. FSL A5-0031]|uniref:hypothetical protein n=1 Tax=Paenibacillus sp. FSL A5-0031 TaxID=1920420 RepID=UPI00096F81B2|nr:hypothetical protein [Paenibacillus sp. FSL A5-0031]OME78738.1 hypothetical protein BK120_23700 [Paenibacillus sp. FSL A5-0031]